MRTRRIRYSCWWAQPLASLGYFCLELAAKLMSCQPCSWHLVTYYSYCMTSRSAVHIDVKESFSTSGPSPFRYMNFRKNVRKTKRWRTQTRSWENGFSRCLENIARVESVNVKNTRALLISRKLPVDTYKLQMPLFLFIPSSVVPMSCGCFLRFVSGSNKIFCTFLNCKEWRCLAILVS